MTEFLPTQEQGPGPTDAPLASWQSYSAYTTSIYDFTSTITRIAYDPAGNVGPSVVVEEQAVHTKSVGYKVVNHPLLYTGPFPAPPLGTLYTTAGEVVPPTPTSNPASAGKPSPTTAFSGTSDSESSESSSKSQASSPSQDISAPSPVATARPNTNQKIPLGSNSNSNGNNNNNSNNNNNGGSNSEANQGEASGNSNQSGENNGSGKQGGSGSGTSEGVGGGQGSQSANQTNGGSQGQQQPTAITPTQSGSNGQGNGSESSAVGGGSGSGSGSNTGSASSPMATPAPSPSNASSSPNSSNLSIASAESVSASQASVSASNAAASASLASISATNGAQSSSASAASASAVSAASSASAMSASASSLSASAASAASSSSLTLPPPRPTSTGPGIPLNPLSLSSHGLSGGQIAGIVLGSIFGLLLLLLLIGLFLARRRRYNAAGSGAAGGDARRKLSDRWATAGYTRARNRGNYAAVGAGAGLAGAGFGAAAAAGGSINSNEWEEDRLSGGDGSGFFVVGGKRAGVDPFAEGGKGKSTPDAYPAATGLAGFGAGIAAALGGKRRGRTSGKEADHQAIPTSSREADLADEDLDGASDDDGDVDGERRGLMSFASDVGDSSEMTQAGPSGWMQMPSRGERHPAWDSAAAAAAAGAVGGGAAALGMGATYAARNNRSDTNRHEESRWLAGGIASPSRAAARQSQSSPIGSGSRSGSPYGSSSGSGSKATIRQSYGNVGPSSNTSRQSGLRNSGISEEGSPFDQETLLGAGAAGVGLSALAAGHRSSAMSQVGSDNGQEDRFSGFISKDTPLLGPGAYQSRDNSLASGRNPSGLGTVYSQDNRLPTIRSVGEFGERGSSLAPSGSRSGTGTGSEVGTGSGSGTRSGYGSVRSAPLYTASAGPSTTGLPFYTPTETPNVPQDPFEDRPQLGDIADEQKASQHDNHQGESASTAALGAVVGLLGGILPAGWTRTEERPELSEIRSLNMGHERGQGRDDAQSQRASVYNNGSTMDHGVMRSGAPSHSPSLNQPTSSGSGQSSAPNSAPSHKSSPDEIVEEQEDPFDEDAATGGYTASVSNLSQNVSSGNSRSGSRRSGQTTSTGFSRGNTSGIGSNSNSQSNSSGRRNQSSSGGSGSTGAASYNPSYLGRQSTSSTRGAGTSSGSSRLAARGGSASRRRETTDGDNDSSLVVGTTLDSDGRSSRATAGGGEDLPRVSFDPGLGSVREGSEGGMPSSDFYPSESLGAAVMRRAEREQQEANEELTVPGVAASQWRQSPRVESASQRASDIILRARPSLRDLQRPDSPSSSSPRRARLPDPEDARAQRQEPSDDEEEGHGDPDDAGLWPKFLRF